ncbi:hypothetical protein HD554DRAFT_2170209 [Boletus coccyginus]|nr:hypothetical protein HD554DRAFT_2170209 [Boletus coccyginus]
MSALSLSQIIEDLRLLGAMTYGSYTLLVWDYLLTLDDEVDVFTLVRRPILLTFEPQITYVWDSPSSVVKYLFIGNRYVNLLVQPVYISGIAGVLPLDSSATCLAFSWVVGLSKSWSYGSVHVLVLLRVWIFYGRGRNTTIALFTAFILYLCASITLLAYTIVDLNSALGGMCMEELPSFSWLIWVVEFLLEACLFGLAVFTLRRQKSASEFPRVSRLVHSLYRHAIIFFLANTFGDILNIIAWTVFAGTPLLDVANMSVFWIVCRAEYDESVLHRLTITLVNITGQRLAIDLRRLHIQKEATQSEVSRVVAIQLAAFDNSGPVAP